MQKMIAVIISSLALVFIAVDSRADWLDVLVNGRAKKDEVREYKDAPKVKVDGIIAKEQHSGNDCKYKKDCVEWEKAATLFKEKGKPSRESRFEDRSLTIYVYYYDSPDKTEVFTTYFHATEYIQGVPSQGYLVIDDDFVVNKPGFVLEGNRIRD